MKFNLSNLNYKEITFVVITLFVFTGTFALASSLSSSGVLTMTPANKVQIGDVPTGTNNFGLTIVDYYTSIGKDVINPLTVDNQFYDVLVVGPTLTQNTDKASYIAGTSPDFTVNGSGTISGVIGNSSWGTYSGTGAVTDLVAGYLGGGTVNGGTVESVVGAEYLNRVNGGTVGDATGVWIFDSDVFGGSITGNTYGLRIGDQTSGGLSNFAIFTDKGIVHFGDSVGVGTEAPDDAALLDVSSTTQGFLPPRMTTTERDAIVAPPAGLMIYNTTTNKLNVFTTNWETVTSL